MRNRHDGNPFLDVMLGVVVVVLLVDLTRRGRHVEEAGIEEEKQIPRLSSSYSGIVVVRCLSREVSRARKRRDACHHTNRYICTLGGHDD